MKILLNTFLVIASALFMGCSTLHRIEMAPSSGGSHGIDDIDLTTFFKSNGYRKKNWTYEVMFGPAVRKNVNQTIRAYWVKDSQETAVGRKIGHVQVWEVIENQTLVIYVVGSQSRSHQVVESVNNLLISMSSLYPDIKVVKSKNRFVDVR